MKLWSWGVVFEYLRIRQGLSKEVGVVEFKNFSLVLRRHS